MDRPLSTRCKAWNTVAFHRCPRVVDANANGALARRVPCSNAFRKRGLNEVNLVSFRQLRALVH